MALTIANIVEPGMTDSGFYCTGTTDAAAATAQTIYCGFKPNRITVLNLTDLIRDEFFTGMTAANQVHTTALGAVTQAVGNGITLLDGSEAVVAAAAIATGSPNTTQGGPGFTIGTGPLIASKSFLIVAHRA